MKTKMFLLYATTAVLALTLVSFYGIKQGTPWVVPAKYKSMVNPKAKVADAEGIGKQLYTQHCVSCHGAKGKGDGKKAAQLDTKMRDMSKADVQGQTDGELYYKGFIGRDDMPNFEKKITDDADRWFLINYLRTFAVK